MTEPTPRLHVVGPDDTPGPADHPPDDKAVPEFRTSWTADELMAIEFAPPKWAVPGIVAEGVSLLAGPPKIGKSWMSLGMALDIAAGGRVFNGIDVDPGDVLYLALEDTPRRLQFRIGRLLGGVSDLEPYRGLTVATSCPPLPQGGDDRIAAWLDTHPDARLVVLDVFAKIRGTSPPGLSAYDADYSAIGRVKKLADHYGVAFVLVHHVRKQGAEDFLAEVSGTNGLAGAADATLVLKRARGEASAEMHVTGRDIDETSYALDFHAASGAWQLLDGPPDEHTLPDTRAQILRHLRANPGQTPKAIAEATGINYANVRRTCVRMVEDGQLAVDAAGRYAATHQPETVEVGHRDPPPTVTPVTAVTQPALTRQDLSDSTDTKAVTAVTEQT